MTSTGRALCRVLEARVGHHDLGRAGVGRTPGAPPPAATDGERWTRDQLGTLRERRFAPAAIGAFLLASQRRANQTRASRPELALARQAWGWIALGAVPWLARAVRRGGPRRGARSGLAWWLMCALMLDWHLGMVETVDGRPRRLRAADALTLARAWLVPVAWAQPSVGVYATAALTDALDGPLARRGEPTRAGRDLEGLVDMCFASAALHGARRQDLIAPWAIAAESLRIGVGTAYGLRAYFLDATPPDAAVMRAGRPVSALRVTGLLLAARGCRRAAAALVGVGALASGCIALTALISIRSHPNTPSSDKEERCHCQPSLSAASRARAS